jgi:hypothetical protein
MARLLMVLSHRFKINVFVRTGKILGIKWYMCSVSVTLCQFHSGVAEQYGKHVLRTGRFTKQL